MEHRARHRTLIGIAAVAIAGGVVWVVGVRGHSAAAPPAQSTASVDIPADRFVPNVTVVQEGGRVTFHNGDADEHTVTSVPGDPVTFNLAVEPGRTVTLELPRAGIYRYYCSVHATYDTRTGQVAGRDGTDNPMEPMAGVVVAEPRWTQ